VSQDAVLSSSLLQPARRYIVRMGKTIPTEGGRHTTADISKVHDGGVTKAPQTSRENKPLSREDEARALRVLAKVFDRPVEESSKPEVIDLDSGSGGKVEDTEEEDGAEDDGDEDEDELWADDTWEDEWEDEGDDVTKVALPRLKTTASFLTTREAFIVTSVHEIRDPVEDKYHEVHGVYSNVLDANTAAQDYAQGQGFTSDGDRYKERIYMDGTFHCKAKGGRDERISVDVEAKQYTVRQELAV